MRLEYYCSKWILEEYSDITSLLTDEIVKVHKEIHTSIDQIDPLSEYDNFIELNRYVKFSCFKSF